MSVSSQGLIMSVQISQQQQFQQNQSQYAEAINLDQIYKWILDLPNPITRENALVELG